MKTCPRCNGSGTAFSSAPHSDLTCRCSACNGAGKVNDATYRALPEVRETTTKRPARKGPAQADQAGLGFGPAGVTKECARQRINAALRRARDVAEERGYGT